MTAATAAALVIWALFIEPQAPVVVEYQQPRVNNRIATRYHVPITRAEGLKITRFYEIRQHCPIDAVLAISCADGQFWTFGKKGGGVGLSQLGQRPPRTFPEPLPDNLPFNVECEFLVRAESRLPDRHAYRRNDAGQVYADDGLAAMRYADVAPTRKMSAVGIGGAVAVILIWLLETYVLAEPMPASCRRGGVSDLRLGLRLDDSREPAVSEARAPYRVVWPPTVIDRTEYKSGRCVGIWCGNCGRQAYNGQVVRSRCVDLGQRTAKCKACKREVDISILF